jgi:hypothetical protein
MPGKRSSAASDHGRPIKPRKHVELACLMARKSVLPAPAAPDVLVPVPDEPAPFNVQMEVFPAVVHGIDVLGNVRSAVARFSAKHPSDRCIFREEYLYSLLVGMQEFGGNFPMLDEYVVPWVDSFGGHFFTSLPAGLDPSFVNQIEELRALVVKALVEGSSIKTVVGHIRARLDRAKLLRLGQDMVYADLEARGLRGLDNRNVDLPIALRLPDRVARSHNVRMLPPGVSFYARLESGHPFLNDEGHPQVELPVVVDDVPDAAGLPDHIPDGDDDSYERHSI